MKLLELFSGTGSVGKVARDLDWEVTSVDISDELGHVDILTDIMKWDYKVYAPNHFDIIWGSPPCASFSKFQNCRIGIGGRTMETLRANMHAVGVPLLMKLLEIIAYFQPTFYFIENPQTGRMKEFLSLPHYDVDYCRYGYKYRKRTRIWTNVVGFSDKLCEGEGKCHGVENGKHKQQVIGANTTLAERYSIPRTLIEDLLFLCFDYFLQ